MNEMLLLSMSVMRWASLRTTRKQVTRMKWMDECFPLESPQRVKRPQHIIHVFIPRTQRTTSHFYHQSIYTNFYLLLLLWPLTRKAKVKKGQDRCQIKQLLNRGLGCDPQIRNGDPSQHQGKTFLWAVAQSLKCNWDLQPGLKKKLVFFICLLIFSSLRIEAIFPFYLWLPVVDMREGELVYGKCSHHEKWGWTRTAERAAVTDFIASAKTVWQSGTLCKAGGLSQQHREEVLLL